MSAKTEGAEVVLAVRDEGTGIAPDDLRIFEPFYDQRTWANRSGPVDLSRADAIARWQITVESAPGQDRRLRCGCRGCRRSSEAA